MTDLLNLPYTQRGGKHAGYKANACSDNIGIGLWTNNPAGTRVRYISMPQEPYPVPSGTIGTVTCVDDIGTIRVNWDNHSSLGLVPDVEQFEIVEK